MTIDSPDVIGVLAAQEARVRRLHVLLRIHHLALGAGQEPFHLLRQRTAGLGRPPLEPEQLVVALE